MDRLAEDIDHAAKHALILLHQKKLTTEVFEGAYWPLFFEESGQTPCSEIDSCSTSLGIMSVSQLANGLQSGPDRQLIIEAIGILIRMRNQDGSWPSVVSVNIEAPPMEGIINDTVMALHALLDGGFMVDRPMPEFSAGARAGPELNSISQRIEFIGASLAWLCRNRTDRAWAYTGVEHIENAQVVMPAVLPTANVVLLFRRVLDYSRTIPQCTYTSKIQSAYDDALQWLLDVQHNSGGYGKTPNDKPRAPHTAIALWAISTTDNERAVKAAERAVKWIIRWYTLAGLLKVSAEDVFDEYDQIFFKENTKYRKRVIHHETYLEAVLLSAMVEASNHLKKRTLNLFNRIQYGRLMRSMVRRVLANQQQEGAFRGAFASRRGAPGEKYPIYCIYYAMNSLLRLRHKRELLGQGYLRVFIKRNAVLVCAAGALLVLYLGVTDDPKARDVIGIIALGVLAEILCLFLPAKVSL